MSVFVRTTIVLISSLFCYLSVHAEINTEIEALQKEWARIKYTVDKKEHETAFEKLTQQAASVRQAQPNNADAYLWEGIILSTYSGAIGTLRALDAVTRSRDALEKSLKIDPNASKGAANTYIGTLYFLVPEWPIGFGDLDLAKEHLDKAIALNPNDIDVNFFYGDFLKKTKKYEDAENAYKKALTAPDRLGQELADKGRRDEAKKRLEKIREKLSALPPPKV